MVALVAIGGATISRSIARRTHIHNVPSGIARRTHIHESRRNPLSQAWSHTFYAIEHIILEYKHFTAQKTMMDLCALQCWAFL